jgi:hypothetical protein
VRLAALLSLCAVAALAAAVGAGAQGAPRSEAVLDAAQDVRGRLDVRRVGLSLLPGRRTLRAEVTMRRSWGTADLRATSGADGWICMRLYTRRRPADDPPDLLVCATPQPDGEGLVGEVLRERRSGALRRLGTARVSRPSGRAVHLRFPRALLGDAIGVRFGAESVSRGRGCPAPVGCRDLGPDAPDTMWLDLR